MTEINLSELLSKTQAGIREALHRVDRDDLADRNWFDLEQFAYLFFILRHLDDDADLFPSGKWATIQRVEDLCDKEAYRQLNQCARARAMK